jgi:hypothetical protein
LNILQYILINLLLFSSWYLLLYHKKEALRFADRLVGTFVLGLTQIITTQMVLGVVFKKLYAVPLLFLNVFISLGILIVACRDAGTSGVLSEIRDEAVGFLEMLREDMILLSVFTLFLISTCWMIFLGYLFPSYSWDALYYHLPIVGQIIQSGAIQESTNPSFIQQYINIFSKNINLFFLWNVIFLKSDVIVDLGQLFFTMAGVVSIYSSAVKLKIRKNYALYASLLFFFTPVLILQSTTNYVDAAVSMLFIIALNFLIFREDGSPASEKTSLLISGLAAGILLGSKPTAPLFIIIIFGALIIRESLKTLKAADRGHSSGKTLGIYFTCFMIPVFLLGGFWYMRNWILHGNPVYYIDISIFGLKIFSGLKADWVESSPEIIGSLGYVGSLFHVWLERVGYYMYDSRLSGFGPIWYILLLPAMIFSIIHAISKKRYDFLFIVTVIIVTFLVHPRNWTTRYVIFVVGAGALSFGHLLEYFEKRGAVLKITVLMLAAYTFLTANSPCIMPEKINEFIQLPANERTLSRHKPFNLEARVRSEFGYWIWLDNNISSGDTLAYTFEKFDLNTAEPFFTAPLWNRELSNKVFYVKSNSYKKWVEDLTDVDATYILIKRGSAEDRWVEQERRVFYSVRWMGNITEKFRIMYTDEKYMIIKYNRA